MNVINERFDGTTFTFDVDEYFKPAALDTKSHQFAVQVSRAILGSLEVISIEFIPVNGHFRHPSPAILLTRAFRYEKKYRLILADKLPPRMLRNEDGGLVFRAQEGGKLAIYKDMDALVRYLPFMGHLLDLLLYERERNENDLDKNDPAIEM